MDFSFLSGGSKQEELQIHPTPILTKVYSEGVVKVFHDTTGHAERVEIALPQGKVIVVKDFEKLPTLAHYRKVQITSNNDEVRGTLDIIPSSRQLTNSASRFYEGKIPIGTGSGNIGMAIARQMLPLGDDPRNASDSYVDAEVISEIKALLTGHSR